MIDLGSRPIIHPPGTPSDTSSFADENAVPIPAQEIEVSAVLPSLAEICSIPINTSKNVPARCRQQWAVVLTGALYEVVNDNTTTSWTLLAMLPKRVLPAPYRGGRKGFTSYTNFVKQRLQLWQARDFSTLWRGAVNGLQKKRSMRTREGIDEETRSAVRAELLAR